MTEPPVATERWAAVLDEFERTLDGYVSLSVAAHDPGNDESPPVPRFSPPDDLGPMPEGLRIRAVELSARAGLIGTELIRTRDATASQLAALHRPKDVYGRDPQSTQFDGVG